MIDFLNTYPWRGSRDPNGVPIYPDGRMVRYVALEVPGTPTIYVQSTMTGHDVQMTFENGGIVVSIEEHSYWCPLLEEVAPCTSEEVAEGCMFRLHVEAGDVFELAHAIAGFPHPDTVDPFSKGICPGCGLGMVHTSEQEPDDPYCSVCSIRMMLVRDDAERLLRNSVRESDRSEPDSSAEAGD